MTCQQAGLSQCNVPLHQLFPPPLHKSHHHHHHHCHHHHHQHHQHPTSHSESLTPLTTKLFALYDRDVADNGNNDHKYDDDDDDDDNNVDDTE